MSQNATASDPVRPGEAPASGLCRGKACARPVPAWSRVAVTLTVGFRSRNDFKVSGRFGSDWRTLRHLQNFAPELRFELVEMARRQSESVPQRLKPDCKMQHIWRGLSRAGNKT